MYQMGIEYSQKMRLIDEKLDKERERKKEK